MQKNIEISKKKPLLVVHLPRTGGTALSGYIRERSNYSICPGLEQEEISHNLKHDQYEIYIGHFGVDIISCFEDSFKSTFVREPLSRTFSMWQQMLRTNNTIIDNKTSCAEQFENWCYTNYDQDQSLFNQMTLWLSVGRVRTEVTSNELELATQNVQQFDFVGLVDMYQIFFQLFINRFGLPAHPVNYENSSALRLPQLSTSFINWFVHAARFDIKLYSEMQNLAWKKSF